jgi:hypothetical protein
MIYWTAVEATPTLARRLKRMGVFQRRDINENIYYVLPNSGHVIFLRDPEGIRWYSDRAAWGQSLKSYLANLRPGRVAFIRAMIDAGLWPRPARRNPFPLAA